MIVKVRRAPSGTGGIVSMVTIPKKVADALQAAGVAAFRLSLTDDGLLLAPVFADESDELEEVPAWLAAERRVRASDDDPARDVSRRATRTDAERTASA